MSDVVSSNGRGDGGFSADDHVGHEEGIRISFIGKDNAKRLARKVQPRTSRRIAKYSTGSEEEQANNLLIEGENLQAMVTLYRDRGGVDLILTDPPYNTGRDFRYNDKWDEDPNDPDLGELVAKDDPGRHIVIEGFGFGLSGPRGLLASASASAFAFRGTQVILMSANCWIKETA